MKKKIFVIILRRCYANTLFTQTRGKLKKIKLQNETEGKRVIDKFYQDRKDGQDGQDRQGGHLNLTFQVTCAGTNSFLSYHLP